MAKRSVKQVYTDLVEVLHTFVQKISNTYGSAVTHSTTPQVRDGRPVTVSVAELVVLTKLAGVMKKQIILETVGVNGKPEEDKLVIKIVDQFPSVPSALLYPETI